MKAFSKEWWLNIATTVIRDFELCSFDNGIPHITFRQTYDWDDEDLDLFTNYCFKRYAEAYHREKMMFTKNEMVQLLDASEATQIEQERILGIIEELSWDETGGGYYLLEKIELIEKIKG